MLSFKQFLLEAKDRYIHGTTRDRIDSIKKNWINPQAGDYTKQFYDEPEHAVFVAKDTDHKRALSSIRGQIARKIKKPIYQVDHKDIEQHGALIVTRGEFLHAHADGMSRHSDGTPTRENPNQAEPGDYYSTDDARPTGILKGKRLVQHLKKQKALS